MCSLLTSGGGGTIGGSEYAPSANAPAGAEDAGRRLLQASPGGKCAELLGKASENVPSKSSKRPHTSDLWAGCAACTSPEQEDAAIELRERNSCKPAATATTAAAAAAAAAGAAAAATTCMHFNFNASRDHTKGVTPPQIDV